MRIDEARKAVEEAGGDWEIFQKWMRGQTVSMYEDGETDIYEWDVERFIRYKCNPDNEPFEEWD